jgi:hypothetical protein
VDLFQGAISLLNNNQPDFVSMNAEASARIEMSGGRSGVLAVVVAAVLGLTVFGGLAWRAITVQQMDGAGAQHNFEDVLASAKSPTPLVRRESGRFVRRPSSPLVGPPPGDLHVLA